jgi:molybdopterin converting factor small subunit
VPLTIFLSSSLREYIPGYEPSAGLELNGEKGITIADLCQKIGIPIEKIKIVMVNGRKEDMNYIIQGDERLGFFPPVGGG